MRTITEFPGFLIKLIAKTKSDLTAAGTAEADIQAKIGTDYKIEGDRLTHLMKVLSLSEGKIDSISRARVLAGEDEAKMPQGCVKEGEVFYHIEHVVVAKKADHKKGGRFGKDDKKGKKHGKGGRRNDREGGHRGNKDRNGPRQENKPSESQS